MTPQLLNAGPSERGWHRLATALTCPQRYAYDHILKLRLPRRKPLIQGSLLHQGLAHYYIRLKAIQDGTDPEAYYDPITAMALLTEQEDAEESPHPLDETYAEHLDEMLVLMRLYPDFWGHVDASTYRIVAVEEQMRAHIPEAGWSLDPLVREWLFTQRLDLVLCDPDGYYIVADHKTASRLSIVNDRAYFRDGQFQGFHIFGRNKWGSRYGGALINYCVKGKTVKRRFHREPVPVLTHRMECFPDTIRHAERVVQDLERRGVDPWRWPKACGSNGSCENRYGACEAAELCDFGPSGVEVWR